MQKKWLFQQFGNYNEIKVLKNWINFFFTLNDKSYFKALTWIMYSATTLSRNNKGINGKFPAQLHALVNADCLSLGFPWRIQRSLAPILGPISFIFHAVFWTKLAPLLLGLVSCSEVGTPSRKCRIRHWDCGFKHFIKSQQLLMISLTFHLWKASHTKFLKCYFI